MGLEDNTTERWDRLIETGALVRNGGTEEEPEYNFNLPVLEVVDPELYQEYMNEIDLTLASLVTQGLLDVRVTPDEAAYYLTDKGKDMADALRQIGAS